MKSQMSSAVFLACVFSLALGSALQGNLRPRFGTFVDPFSALDFWSPFSKAADLHWSSGLRASHVGTPEITETETGFYITIDTAGYTKDELDIHVLGKEVCHFCTIS